MGHLLGVIVEVPIVRELLVRGNSLTSRVLKQREEDEGRVDLQPQLQAIIEENPNMVSHEEVAEGLHANEGVGTSVGVLLELEVVPHRWDGILCEE